MSVDKTVKFNHLNKNPAVFVFIVTCDSNCGIWKGKRMKSRSAVTPLPFFVILM